MESDNKRRPSELLKRGYSEEELENIYELGHFFLENGDTRRADVIFNGVLAVAPDFAMAWLGKAYIQIQNGDFDDAIVSVHSALRIRPDSLATMLYLVACLLTVGDFNAAGTYLGEIGERLEDSEAHPNIVRFYKAQIVRFQNRKK